MTRARWIQIGLPLLILFTVSMIDKSNINILLANKPFLQDLGIKDGAIKGTLSSIFLITYAIGQFGWGFVVDRIGACKSGLIGIFFWVVAMVLGGMAESVSALFWSRSILGLSEGVLYPIALTLTAKWFPANEQAKAQALWFNGNSLGPVIGLPIIAIVAQNYGWRESYHALGAVSLLCLVMFWLMVRNSPGEHRAVNAAEKEYIEKGASTVKKEIADTGEVKAVSILLISVLLMPAALTMTMLHKVASPRVMGRIGGIFGSVSYALAAVGPIVVGAVSQASGSYTGGFLALMSFIVISLVLCLVLMRKGY
ncbi:Major Facilitator Superfamily protein [Brevibacillus centrosporus]|uniref:Major Facilitator Superfamily protein n=2 Tax=Brevibacillus centrosporus TaxID=54910 RepID=A0A1I4DP00_9BACL|nr:Major Facilitator Superfamily protein [Brevibacillus centrosporus]